MKAGPTRSAESLGTTHRIDTSLARSRKTSAAIVSASGGSGAKNTTADRTTGTPSASATAQSRFNIALISSSTPAKSASVTGRLTSRRVR